MADINNNGQFENDKDADLLAQQLAAEEKAQVKAEEEAAKQAATFKAETEELQKTIASTPKTEKPAPTSTAATTDAIDETEETAGGGIVKPIIIAGIVIVLGIGAIIGLRPSQEAPVIDNTPTEEEVIDETTGEVDAPIVDEIEEPVTEEPVTEEPVTEEPVIEEPTGEIDTPDADADADAQQ